MWRFGWAFRRWLFSLVSSKDGCKFLMHIRVEVVVVAGADDEATVGVVVMVLSDGGRGNFIYGPRLSEKKKWWRADLHCGGKLTVTM